MSRNQGAVLKALANPVRVEIVRQLVAAGTELNCGVQRVPVSESTSSRHFRALREVGSWMNERRKPEGS
jgi:DNA-binding transcriptional ArsR family regulator